MNYYGSAVPTYPAAIMNVIEVQNATDEEVLNIAINNNVDLNDYSNGFRRR